MTTVHLGFDMGIRNLAYCMMQHDISGSWNILAWDNVDLLEGGISAQDAKRCVGCGGIAKYTDAEKRWCLACASQKRVKKTATSKPALPILPCKMAVKDLRTFASAEGVADAKKLKKDALFAWASAKYLLPWKPVKTMDTSLTVIYEAMNTWLSTVLPTFASATRIRLENQPVMKGPTMKSVQIILFTLLHHRLKHEHGWSGTIEFVHAGTKNKKHEMSGTTDEGKAYRERKKSAETEVETLLATQTHWKTFFHSRVKKSDLADAFLMAYRK